MPRPIGSHSSSNRDTAADRLTGKVVRVVADRGFCFLACDQDQQDYFCHVSALEDGIQLKGLQPGDRVSFSSEESTKGPRAGKVRIAQP